MREDAAHAELRDRMMGELGVTVSGAQVTDITPGEF